MIIDLHKYGTELRFWAQAFEPFVDPSSRSALRRIFADLENGRENLDRFPWKLPKPIMSRVTSAYDGTEKAAHPVYVTWQFHSEFKRIPPAKQRLWDVLEMVTHIKVMSAENDGAEIIHFHYDMKSEKQLGPHTHLQISEMFLEEKQKVALAVPRFPSAVLLPTDCLDLVLAEFFPNEWPKEQANSAGISALRAGQLRRAESLIKALCNQWDSNPKMTPFAKTQNCFMPSVQLA